MNRTERYCRAQEHYFEYLRTELMRIRGVAYRKKPNADYNFMPLEIAYLLVDRIDTDEEPQLEQYVEEFFMDSPFEMNYHEMSLETHDPFKYIMTACACMEFSYLKAIRMKNKTTKQHFIDHLDELGRTVNAHSWMLMGYWTPKKHNPGAEEKKRIRDDRLARASDLLERWTSEKDKKRKSRILAEIKDKTGLTTERSIYNYRKRLTEKP